MPFNKIFMRVDMVFIPKEAVLKLDAESCFLYREVIETSISSREVSTSVIDE